MGTPQYMSPEQAEGKTDELDAASDQFSLAAIVYEMLTGRKAFCGRDAGVGRLPDRPRAAGPDPRLPSRAAGRAGERRVARPGQEQEGPIPVGVGVRGAPALDGDAARHARSRRGAGADEGDADAGRYRYRGDDGGLRAAVGDGGRPAREHRGLPAANGRRAGAGRSTSRQRRADRRGTATLGRAADGGRASRAGRTRAPRSRADGGARGASRAACRLIARPSWRARLVIVAIVVGVVSRARMPPLDSASADARRQRRRRPRPARPRRPRRPSRAAWPRRRRRRRRRRRGRDRGSRRRRMDTLDPPAPPSEAAASARKPPARTRPHGAGAAKAPAAASRDQAARPSAPGAGQCRITVGTYPWSELWIDGADTGQQTPVVGLPIALRPPPAGVQAARSRRSSQIENVILNEGREFKRQYELQGRGHRRMTRVARVRASRSVAGASEVGASPTTHGIDRLESAWLFIPRSFYDDGRGG